MKHEAAMANAQQCLGFNRTKHYLVMRLITLSQVLDLVARVSPKLRAPIILFQYYNPILRKGPDEYCRAAKEAGAAGSTH